MKEIKEDILAARDVYGQNIRTLFLAAGNTIAMKTEDLCEICHFAGRASGALYKRYSARGF